jgi:hypothetical protein
MTNYQRTANWLEACGKEPSEANLSVQIGCHLEEFVELLLTIRTDKDGYARLLERCIGDLGWFATKLKRGESMAHIPHRLRVDALDALCDCEVTGNGIAYLAGFSKDAADLEVLRSNESKLVDGKAVILEGGKIGKPPSYSPPDLKSFV